MDATELDHTPRAAGNPPPNHGVDLSPRFGPYHASVTAADIRAYAQATNDPDPAAQEGRQASPLFSASLVMAAYSQSHRASVPVPLPGTRATAHAAHEVLIHRPITPGMDVSWQTLVLGTTTTRAGVIVVHRIEMTDSHDRMPVLEHHWSAIHIGAVPDQPAIGNQVLGDPVTGDPSTEDLATGNPGTVETVLHVPADLAHKYAMVSGGLIHESGDGALDPRAAAGGGDHRPFLQGLCTLATVSNLVLQESGVADRTRVRRIAARFSRPVFAGSTLLVSSAELPTGTADHRALAFAARESDGRPAVTRGRIEVAAV